MIEKLPHEMYIISLFNSNGTWLLDALLRTYQYA